MRLILAAGTTRTAEIEGISAAGADPAATVHTPAADAELLEFGDVVRAPGIPASPTGCPTPAVITRACRDVLGFETTVVDAGLATKTAAPTVSVGARPGADVRDPDPVPSGPGTMAAAREFGRAIPDAELLVGETIPGGTTTALGVLRALGEDVAVSSSLPENPIAKKERVVADALDRSGIDPGDLAGDPQDAVRYAGDPVQATVAGIARGALETGTDVTLAGGTQMLAVAALLRHAGVDDSFRVATTSFVAGDPAVDLRAAAADLDVALAVTDPGFDGADHPALARYVAGEAKEGVGMGGALRLADRRGVLGDVRDRIRTLADDLGIAPDDEANEGETGNDETNPDADDGPTEVP